MVRFRIVIIVRHKQLMSNHCFKMDDDIPSQQIPYTRIWYIGLIYIFLFLLSSLIFK